MTARQRPGPELTDAERLSAVLGDALDWLEAFQTPDPHPGLEEVAHQIRFVRRELIKQIPDGIDHGQEVGHVPAVVE